MLWKCCTQYANLLRNLYAGQEATVRTGHVTTDWFQIRKAFQWWLPGTGELFFIYIYLFVIDWWLLYNIGLISVIYQHELTTAVHMSLPHLIPLGCYITSVWVPWVKEQISIGYLFICGSVYASMLLSPFISPSPSSSPPFATSLFSMSVSLLLLSE